MSSQHKAPLAAFLVVCIACVVVLVNAVRGEALTGFLLRPTQALVVSGARLAPEPAEVLDARADVVRSVVAAPKLVEHVVNGPTPERADRQPKRARPARSAAAAAPPAVAAAPVVTTPPAVPTPVPGKSATLPGHWFAQHPGRAEQAGPERGHGHASQRDERPDSPRHDQARAGRGQDSQPSVRPGAPAVTQPNHWSWSHGDDDSRRGHRYDDDSRHLWYGSDSRGHDYGHARQRHSSGWR